MGKHRSIDLLGVSDAKRAELIWKIRRRMQQYAIEEKLLHSLLNVEPSAINKAMIIEMQERLNGFEYSRKISIC